jgi:uracil-DNA glycosylase
VDELSALPRCRVLVALGRIAFESGRLLLGDGEHTWPDRPRFSHGATFPLEGRPALVACYHPSRQNTHTGRLTPEMLQEVFAVAKALAANPR